MEKLRENDFNSRGGTQHGDASSGENPESERRQRVSVAAYYNAERRGFSDGGDIDDWLAAENSIDSLNASTGATSGDTVGAAAAADSRNRDPSGGPEEERIEPDQIHEWAERLAVSEERLRIAIQRVGPQAGPVLDFLNIH